MYAGKVEVETWQLGVGEKRSTPERRLVLRLALVLVSYGSFSNEALNNAVALIAPRCCGESQLLAVLATTIYTLGLQTPNI